MSGSGDFRRLKELALGMSLLYVDDNKGLQRQAFRVLKNFFEDVSVAADGEEGVAL